MIAFSFGDTPPNSKVVSFCHSLMTDDIRRIINDGSYEEIVFNQNLGTVLNNKKQEILKIVNNDDLEECKKQTFIRLIDYLYSSDMSNQKHNLLKFLDSIIQKAYGDIRLEFLLRNIQNYLTDLGYSENMIKKMQIYHQH